MPYNLTVGEKFIAYTQRKKKPEKCFSVEVIIARQAVNKANKYKNLCK